MDPKEYRRIFRRALGLLRDLEKGSGATFPILVEFEAAYEAECDATEALEREVAMLQERVRELKQSEI
jgi:hypothetical protein